LFTVGESRLALECRSVVEVVPRVPMHRPVAAPSALAGFFDYRGTLVPVVDLHALLLDTPCPPERAARIAVVRLEADWRFRLVGLLAEGFTRLIAGDAPQQAALHVPGRPYVGGWVREETGTAIQLVVAERLLGPAWLEMLLGSAATDASATPRAEAAS
jgi:chemotaxis-related protein WspB